MNEDDIEIHEMDAHRQHRNIRVLYVVIVGGETTTVCGRMRETEGHLTSLRETEIVTLITLYETEVDLISGTVGIRNDSQGRTNFLAEFTAGQDFHEGDLQDEIIRNAYKLRDVDVEKIEIEE